MPLLMVISCVYQHDRKPFPQPGILTFYNISKSFINIQLLRRFKHWEPELGQIVQEFLIIFCHETSGSPSTCKK